MSDAPETTELRALLAEWQRAMGASGAQRLANRLGDVYAAAGRVREQIVALASERDQGRAATKLVKLEVWMNGELGERIRDTATLLAPVVSQLGESSPDEGEEPR